MKNKSLFQKNEDIVDHYDVKAPAILVKGDTLETLRGIPDNSVQLAVTSPPYNIGKEYEVKAELDHYLENLKPVLEQLHRVLKNEGSLCWQVGNFVDKSEVFPLDMFFYPILKDLGFMLRNRIIWHFGHGLHCSKRFSGRYETLLWFTKSDSHIFNLDNIRVPSKYPGKTHFRGPKKGQPSGNPLGKNPSDVWEVMLQEWETGMWDIPNVKANHPEKTIHPCQFPIELVERCVLAFTNENDLVLDPFSGVGSSLLAALKHNRRAMGIDRQKEYIEEAKKRIHQLWSDSLPYRPLGKHIYKPTGNEKVSKIPKLWLEEKD